MFSDFDCAKCSSDRKILYSKECNTISRVCRCRYNIYLDLHVFQHKVTSEMILAQPNKDVAFLRSSCNDNWSVPFCKCEYPNETRWKYSAKKTIPCRCGEDASWRLDWTWDKELTVANVISGTEVIFHPVYSQGTSIIRGNEPLHQGRHHYWELKILSPLSGTDIMFGIGTDKVDLLRHRFSFTSVLGIDDQSWGYSYRGVAQHNGQLKYYGKKFSRGRIIGIYVDMFRGTLEYYLNRRSLGRAYSGIPREEGIEIYPMVSSTSAKSSVKLINAASFEDNLRFNCMKVICKYPKLVAQVNAIPGLRNVVQELWFLQLKEPNQSEDFALNNIHLADEAVLCGKKLKLSDTVTTADSGVSKALEINSEGQIYDNLMSNEDGDDKIPNSSNMHNGRRSSSNSSSEDDEIAVMIQNHFF